MLDRGWALQGVVIDGLSWVGMCCRMAPSAPPAHMPNEIGPHRSRLRRSVYAVCICGADVGSISSASSRMELLGQPVVAPTADQSAQGLAPAQECVAHRCGVRGGIGSPEGGCLQLRGVAGRRGEREVHVVRGAGAGELLYGHGWQSGVGGMLGGCREAELRLGGMPLVPDGWGTIRLASNMAGDVPEGGGTSFGTWGACDLAGGRVVRHGCAMWWWSPVGATCDGGAGVGPGRRHQGPQHQAE